MTTTDPLAELSTFEGDDIQSFKFEEVGDTIEGEIIDVADEWTAPKLNQWDNWMRYLPITIRTAEGEEWRLWPMAQYYQDGSTEPTRGDDGNWVGRTVPKEFTRKLIEAAAGKPVVIGGTLKVRYDGKEERTSKSGAKFSVGTYTMRYTPPAPPVATAPLDEF